MEEYIEILEERYERAIDCINSRELPLFVEDTVEDIFSRLVDLIKENKQLEEELEPIRELGIPVKTVVAELNRLEGLEDDRVQMQATIRELIEDYKDQLEEIGRLTFELDRRIPKEIIRMKIEHLQLLPKKAMQKKKVNYAIELLKELLGEEK